MLIDTHQGLYDEDHEAEVILWCLACSMEQYAGIGAETPVVVFARTIHTSEWLLVKEHTETVLVSHTLHQTHQEHIMVYGKIALLIDRCQLKLVWCHLVMAGLARDAEFKCLDFKILHESLHALRDCSEIVVVHLLVLRRVVSHQGTACKHQVRASRIETLIYQEVLLLPSEIGLHLLHLRVKIVANLGSRLTQSMERAEQWSLVVQSLTGIRYKDGRDTEGIVDDEHRRCWIPCRIATSLEGVADTAVRE